MSSWLQQNLTPALKLIGTIMASIGAIIMISAIGKTLLLSPQPLSYYESRCNQEYAPKDERVDPVVCAERYQTEDTQREKRNRQEAIVDGFALFLVGGVLVLMNKKRATKS